MNLDLDGHVFTCQKCGSHDVTKILLPFGEKCFYSGYFMCSSCGTSLCDGREITYYSSCFSKRFEVVQLSFDF